MKCLFVFVATTIVCQVVANPTIHHHRHNADDNSKASNPERGPFRHPKWWRGTREDFKHRSMPSHGPFEPRHDFGFNHGGYGDGSDETDYFEPSYSPHHRGPVWWRPQSPGANIQEQSALCVKSCPVTAEFNPICGSNNVTYPNPGRLECEQRCGIKVKMNKPGPCSNSDQSSEKPLITESQKACLKSCPVTGEYNPVCGSDNITYSNPGRLECAQHCGVDVTISKKSPCDGSEQVTTTENALKIEELTAACMRSCPVTSEYNPVCGSNSVTYANPGRLECAQNCGVKVTVIKKSSCDVPDVANTTENATKVEDLSATCMRSCPVTSEYNPVCGSNNITYANPGRLECAQNCGVKVTLTKKSSCEVLDVTSTTENAIKIEELSAACMKSCPVTTEYNPVCGSNNITYANPGRLECAQTCGVAVTLAKDTTCEAPVTLEEIKSKSNNDTKTTTESNLRTTVSSTTVRNDKEGNDNNGSKNCKEEPIKPKPPSLEEVMECMQTCSLTSELNPVCGTDAITYTNPSKLLCAQYCGVDVRVKKFAPCSSSKITTVHCITTCSDPLTSKPGSLTPPMPSVEACMEACPASVEFKPVCGTNNITYRNLEKLQCARRCGIEVTLKRSVHCSAPEVDPIPKNDAIQVEECIKQCSVQQKYEPVCGSNGVTYNNTGHLACARQCGLDIEMKESDACSTEPDVTSSTSSTTTEKVEVTKPTQNSNMTINPDLIGQIWATTTSKDNDSNEDLSVFQRIGNDPK